MAALAVASLLVGLLLWRRRRRRSAGQLRGSELPCLRTEVPGPLSRAHIDRLARHECPAITARRARRAEQLGTASADPIVWAEAHGAAVRDVDGNVFVDVTSGFGVAINGHSPLAVCDAGAAQLRAHMVHAMGDAFADPSRVELLEELASFAPQLPKGILGCSGSDAVQAALKTAVLKTGRPGVLSFEGSYHGLAYASLAATAYKAADFREPFASQNGAHVTFAELNELPLPPLRERGIGAVLVEPVQGRGGFRAATAAWLKVLRRHCDDEGALLIYDEIYTGFGRTGSWFAYQSAGDSRATGEAGDGAPPPDLLCLGKALGGGFPISACLGTREAMDAWGASKGEALHTQTFLGNPVGCAMARAALRDLRHINAPALAKEKGQRLRQLLAERGYGDDAVRGRGLMVAVRVPDPLRAMADLLQQGVIALPVGDKEDFALAVVPPVTITDCQMRFVVDAITGVCGG